MDIENWEALGISPDFASQQERVLQAFERMQVITTCTCTPYLSGNLPRYREHIAWAESSAVCFANSVLGARSNREGGPSALAAALTGRTPAYGYHLDASRLPNISVQIEAHIEGSQQFGALGKALGELLQPGSVPYLLGIHTASLEALKSLCASLATYGGVALFHIPGITPEAGQMLPPVEQLLITQAHLDAAIASLNEVGLPVDDGNSVEVDFVSLGCPHLTIREIARIAELLRGKQVKKEFWITTARPTKQIADRMGFTRIIETSGARIAADTCCVVAPIKGRFKAMATDSAKACYYAYAKNDFRTVFLPFDEVVKAALE
jgi:predicted aconitase